MSTELPQAIAPEGFTDSMTTDVVESSLRFGYVAEIYGTTQVSAAGGTTVAATSGGTAAAGSTTGAAATAASAGTIVAATGSSTAVVAGVGAAVVAVGAVGAGVAVASGGGGDDGGGQPGGATLDLSGNWTYTGQRSINGTYHSSMTGTASISQSGSTVTVHGTGSYTITTGKTCTEDYTVQWSVDNGTVTSGAWTVPYYSSCGNSSVSGTTTGTAAERKIEIRVQGTVTSATGTTSQVDVSRTYVR